MKYIEYFIYGFGIDVLIVLYYYIINGNNPLKAFIITFALTFISNFFLIDVLNDRSLLLAFSLGASTAVSLLVYLKKTGRLKV